MLDKEPVSKLPESLDELTAQSLIMAEATEGENNQSIIGLKIGPYNAALLRRRQALRLTQGQLARKVGFKTSASIGQIETLRAFPNPEIAKNIANALGTTPEELFPEWLKLFTRDKKQPAQIRVELTESEVNPLLIKRAYEIETTLTAIDPQTEIETKELREKLYDVLGSLTQRERRVVISRLGLEGRPKDLDEVGAEFDISRERVRQIEAKTLRKLRHPSRKKILEGLQDEEPGDLRSPQALINGAVNALYQGDRQRVLTNLAEVEKKYLQDTTGNERLVINNLRQSENWYKWNEDTIIDWYKHLKIPEAAYVNGDEVLEIIGKLKEVEKLRTKIQKD